MRSVGKREGGGFRVARSVAAARGVLPLPDGGYEGQKNSNDHQDFKIALRTGVGHRARSQAVPPENPAGIALLGVRNHHLHRE